MAEEEKDPAQAFQSRLDKFNGDAMAFARQLYDDNFQLRNKNRDLEKLVPAEGSVVLNKAQVERWNAFEALKKKPEELAQALQSTEQLTNEITSLKRKDVLRDVAASAGYKLSVLQDLDGKSEDVEYKQKDVKDKDGATSKVWYVVAEGKESPLEDYATEKWADYLPALKLEQAQTTRKTGMSADPPPVGGSSTLERIRNQEKERQKQTQPTAGLSLKERFLGKRLSAN